MERKAGYIILLYFFLLSCGQEETLQVPEKNNVSIQISPIRHFQTKVVDDDNPASEQLIHNISLFLQNLPQTLLLKNMSIPGLLFPGITS
ncbi:MAG: hypothetical protein LIP05_10350 [Tannerellaceae bacterium]|nr:hypothetical protein [Tannerellaceae bacterium]